MWIRANTRQAIEAFLGFKACEQYGLQYNKRAAACRHSIVAPRDVARQALVNAFERTMLGPGHMQAVYDMFGLDKIDRDFYDDGPKTA